MIYLFERIRIVSTWINSSYPTPTPPPIPIPWFPSFPFPIPLRYDSGWLAPIKPNPIPEIMNNLTVQLYRLLTSIHSNSLSHSRNGTNVHSPTSVHLKSHLDEYMIFGLPQIQGELQVQIQSYQTLQCFLHLHFRNHIPEKIVQIKNKWFHNACGRFPPILGPGSRWKFGSRQINE